MPIRGRKKVAQSLALGGSITPVPFSGGGGLIPDISVGAGFNGTELSGGGTPSFIARTTAQPTAHWIQPTGQRLYQDMVVGVDAEALGGVAYVDFYLEGNTARSYRIVTTELNPRTGAMDKLEGFFVNVKWSSALAIIGGTARMFAKATANDGSMQAKVIGHMASEVTLTAGDYEQPFRLYPRSAQFDWVKKVAASGGDYTTLAAAIQALRAAIAGGVECGSIELAGGTHDPGYPGAGVGWTAAGTGYHRIWASSAATIYRGASFDPANTPGAGFMNEPWRWVLSLAGVEFYGGNLTIDFQHFLKITASSGTSKRLWFNGCLLTNSDGRDTLNWNKGPHPAIDLRDTNEDLVESYFTYSKSTDIDIMNTARMVKNAVRVRAAADTLQQNTRCAVGFYTKDTTAAYFRDNHINAISVHYTGAGAGTLGKASNWQLTLTLNGVADTIQLSATYGDTYFNVSAVVTWLNSHANVTATLLDDTRNAGSLFGTEQTQNNGVALDIKTSTQTVYTTFDNHSEYIHWYTASGPVTNSLLRRCITRNSTWSTSNLNPEANGGIYDVIVADCIWENAHVGTGATNSLGGYHFCWINCLIDNETTNWGDTGADAYSKMINCISRGVYFPNSAWPARPSVEQAFIMPGFQGLPAGANDTGLHSLADNAAWNALFTDIANGNYAPAGVLASTTVPKQTTYDALFNVRAANDAIGPVVIGAAAPSYPT